MRKFIVISIVLLIIAGFAITSSAQDFVPLLAGQDIEVGVIYLLARDDLGFLWVSYAITDPEWELVETHLYVGEDPPTKSAPGRFPYGPEDAVDVAPFLVTYFIYYADFEGELPDPVYIAAQAEVKKQIGVDTETGEPIYQEETAWAEGIQIRTGKNWAMYFEFPLPE